MWMPFERHNCLQETRSRVCIQCLHDSESGTEAEPLWARPSIVSVVGAAELHAPRGRDRKHSVHFTTTIKK